MRVAVIAAQDRRRDSPDGRSFARRDSWAIGAGLFAARHPALVAEQAVQLAPVATRLTVQPNAVLASRRLDLSKPLEAAASHCPRLP